MIPRKHQQTKTNSEVKEEIVVSGDAGLEYDFNKASKNY